MVRVLLVVAAMQLAFQASGEEIRIGDNAYQRRNGKVIIPPARMEVAFKAQREKNPNAELKQPAMFFRASTRVGHFGVIKSVATASNLKSDHLSDVTLKTDLVLAQRMTPRSGLVRADITITAKVMHGPAIGTQAKDKSSATFFFDDFDFSIIADGAHLDMEGQAVIAADIYEYTTALGAKASVIRIVPAELPPPPKPVLKPLVQKPPEAIHQAFANANERDWSDADNNTLGPGTAYNYASGEVWIFLSADGSTLKVPIGRLSRSDRVWVEGWLKSYRSRNRR
jgi:hypothetical protein